MQKNNKLKTILFWVLLSLNIVGALLLLLSFLAGYLPPSASGFVVFCGLAFPYFLVLNIIFIVLWIFFNYRYSLISICVILLNINTIDKHFQFRATPVPESCPSSVKVMSYNANLFGLYKDSDMDKRRQERNLIFQMFRREHPDILCLQEFFWDKSETLNFHTTDSVLSALELGDEPQYSYQYFTDTAQGKYYFGLAIFSKYRIVSAGPVVKDHSSNAIIYVDIKYRGDTIRVYNAHLTSNRMSAADYAVSRQIATNTYQDPSFDKNARKLYRKVADAAKIRQEQARLLRKHIDSSPYPVIVCGDFNDTPAGYCYNLISRKLRDSFRRSGQGRDITYHGASMPHYRIDYILHEKYYNSFGHTVVEELDVSDHYPIYATISLLKKH